MVLFIKKTRLKVGLLVWLSLVNLLVCGVFGWQSYHREKRALLEGIDNQLRAAAHTVARILSPDYHDRVAAGGVSEAEYIDLARALTKYATDAGVFYIYSFIVTGDGRCLTASTSGTPQEWATNTLPRLLEPYDAPAATLAVLETGNQREVEEADAFGNWRSWLVPMKSPHGQRYLIGADVEISHVRELLLQSLWHTVATVVVGFLLMSVFTYWITTKVSRDLDAVVHETNRIARFELESQPMPESRILEVDHLFRSVEDMKSGLRSFRKYVPADLVRDLILSGKEARLGGQRAEVTVFFSDIMGFTRMSEGLTPEELVTHVGEYLGGVGDVVMSERGTLDKFIGDAVMAFWGAPSENPNHAAAACRAALACQVRLEALRERWAAQNRPAIHACIGLNTGPVIVGNLGSENRLDYTVIGDTVNVASRLEGLNRSYGTAILIGESVKESAATQVVARIVDQVAVKGREAGVKVYELLAMREEGTPAVLLEIERLAGEAWQAYAAGEWDVAAEGWRRILEIRPQDGPAKVLLARLEAIRKTQGDGPWDPTWRG